MAVEVTAFYKMSKKDNVHATSCWRCSLLWFDRFPVLLKSGTLFLVATLLSGDCMETWGELGTVWRQTEGSFLYYLKAFLPSLGRLSQLDRHQLLRETSFLFSTDHLPSITQPSFSSSCLHTFSSIL